MQNILLDKTFRKEALLLHQALSLCSSIVEQNLRFEAAFFEKVRVLLQRLMFSGSGGNKLSLKELNDKINELLKQSIKSEGVINLFSTDTTEGFSLLNPKFLNEISKMKEKNIAVEILKKLINEQIRIYKRTVVLYSMRTLKLAY